jgi:hypothetical protein
MHQSPLELVQVGMRAAIRDVQDYVHDQQDSTLDADRLNAYLLGLLITAGAYEDITDGEG